jgi:hypothetical protein
MVDRSHEETGASQPDARTEPSLTFKGWQRYPESLLGHDEFVCNGADLRQRLLDEQQVIFEPQSQQTCKVCLYDIDGMPKASSREYSSNTVSQQHNSGAKGVQTPVRFWETCEDSTDTRFAGHVSLTNPSMCEKLTIE